MIPLAGRSLGPTQRWAAARGVAVDLAPKAIVAMIAKVALLPPGASGLERGRALLVLESSRGVARAGLPCASRSGAPMITTNAAVGADAGCIDPNSLAARGAPPVLMCVRDGVGIEALLEALDRRQRGDRRDHGDHHHNIAPAVDQLPATLRGGDPCRNDRGPWHPALKAAGPLAPCGSLHGDADGGRGGW
jgi:hypothetical protein